MSINNNISKEEFKKIIKQDYFIAHYSRQISFLARKEVLSGKAQFSIGGDGKELPQIVLSKFFKKGDYRAGYYRDQTWMLANEILNGKNLFAQVYGCADLEFDPSCGGRQMNNHFATPLINENSEWNNLTEQYNITCDVAPTAAQMPRSVGLALASKLFRDNKNLHRFKNLSYKGNEVCFCTIGDASTSEGHFWEAVNAAAIIQVPLVIFVWDDGYGISVPTKLQTAKGSISDALQGLQIQENTNGIHILKVNGWDYPMMNRLFQNAVDIARKDHVPVIIHVDELTQPLGHSTSGSHERYKSRKRLNWEKKWDCIKQFKKWITENDIIDKAELKKIENKAKSQAENDRDVAYQAFTQGHNNVKQNVLKSLDKVLDNKSSYDDEVPLIGIKNDLEQSGANTYKKSIEAIRRLKYYITDDVFKKYFASIQENILNFLNEAYSSKLYVESKGKTIYDLKEIKPQYDSNSKEINGYEVLNEYFDKLFETNPLVVTFGEDVGKIGDVNQGFTGLQEKHGKNRIMDTGIREMSIMGQGIGMAMRGLRPIAEIQYLDYLPYGLQALIDDASTVHYRTKGQQICPIIVRTRGHRLVGMWHSGSPLGMILNALRGFVICVPRNMVQSVGLYNSLLKIKDPSIIIECLNGYRLKEKLPSNLLDMTIPLGHPEVIQQGEDITIVSYGSVLRQIKMATKILKTKNISCEVIDVQTLLPFDVHHSIVKSLKKTNKILFIDEDVPGGATAFMFQQVIEIQEGYLYLDSKPQTLTSKEHRPAYGDDGDYISKPSIEDITEKVLEMMEE